jgi:hypothetical protein
MILFPTHNITPSPALNLLATTDRCLSYSYRYTLLTTTFLAVGKNRTDPGVAVWTRNCRETNSKRTWRTKCPSNFNWTQVSSKHNFSIFQEMCSKPEILSAFVSKSNCSMIPISRKQFAIFETVFRDWEIKLKEYKIRSINDRVTKRN